MNIVTSLRFFHENNGIKCQISIKKNRNSRFAKLSRGRFIFNDISVLISDIRIYLNIVFVGMFHKSRPSFIISASTFFMANITPKIKSGGPGMAIETPPTDHFVIFRFPVLEYFFLLDMN